MGVHSERLGELSPERLQAALERAGLGRLRGVSARATGLFGQNLFLDTSEGAWVLRGAPHTDWQLPKERWFAEQLHRHTRAPVPWPYRVEESTELFGWSYALMPRLPGRPPSELPDLPSDERREIALAMGEGLAELHALEAPAPGDWDPASAGIRDEVSLSAQLEAELEGWLEALAAVPGALEAEDHRTIERIRRRAEPTLAGAAPTRFVHLDYTRGNVVVDRRAGHWRLTGVFDLHTAAFSDPERDLVRQLAGWGLGEPDTARAFVAAYAHHRPLRPGHRERFGLYLLIDRLILWHYGRREGIWFPADATFRGFLTPFLALAALLDDPAAGGGC